MENKTILPFLYSFMGCMSAMLLFSLLGFEFWATPKPKIEYEDRYIIIKEYEIEGEVMPRQFREILEK